MDKKLFEHYMEHEDELPEACYSVHNISQDVVCIKKGEGGY